MPLLFSVLVQLPAADLPERYRKWLEEVVVYIISNQEEKEFLRLTADAEREAFIERFWKIRDQDSSTQENEFKKEHENRIRHVNDRFAEGIPGWKSDRGRMWIMHGPPDDIRYDYGGGSLGIDIENPTTVLTGEGNPDKRRYRVTFNKPETEVWIYRRIVGARNNPSYFELIFSRTDPSHVYELNQQLRHLSSGNNLTYPERVRRDFAIMTFLRGHFFGGPYRIVYAGEHKFQDLEDFYESIFYPNRSPTVNVLDFQTGLQDVERPTGEILMEKLALGRSLKEKVRSRLFFETIPLSVWVGSLQASGGSTMVPVSLGLHEEDLPTDRQAADTLDLVMELEAGDGEIAASLVESVKVPARRESAPRKFLYQTRLAARPGKYRLRVYAVLRQPQAAVFRDIELELPDYNQRELTMSDLLLFEQVLPRKAFEAKAPGTEAVPQFLGQSNPIMVKDFVLIPSSDSRFRRGQSLTAFFEVYNPGIPEGEKAPTLRLRCRFEREDGSLQELPQRLLNYVTDSELRRTTYGISIPLLGFNTGRYSVVFDVYDPVRGRNVSKATRFTIY